MGDKLTIVDESSYLSSRLAKNDGVVVVSTRTIQGSSGIRWAEELVVQICYVTAVERSCLP